jgi:hypothetical protein
MPHLQKNNPLTANRAFSLSEKRITNRFRLHSQYHTDKYSILQVGYKKEKTMKKSFVLVLTCLSLFLTLSASNSINTRQAGTNVRLIQNTDSGLQIHYTISKLQSQEILTKNGGFATLDIDDYTSTNIVGDPALPLNRKLISVPLGASVDYRIIRSVSHEYKLADFNIQNKIIPYQRSVSKSGDAASIPFAYNANTYNQNSYPENTLVQIAELGIMRSTRIFTLDFLPVQYNPVSNTIKVYEDVEIAISYRGADWPATKELQAKTWSPVFEGIFSKTIFNYSEPDTRSTLLRNPLGYLIITPPAFESIAPIPPLFPRLKYSFTNLFLAAAISESFSIPVNFNIPRIKADDLTAFIMP